MYQGYKFSCLTFTLAKHTMHAFNRLEGARGLALPTALLRLMQYITSHK
jgi:hypothetical protein